MAFNLIENINTAFEKANLETKMKSFLGENDANVKAGLAFAIPTVVSFVAQKSSNTEGAGGLLNILRTGNHSGNVFNTLSSLFDGRTNMNNFTTSGKQANKIYVGENVTRLSEMLNKTAGFKKSESAGIFFNLVTPVILSAINKQVSIQNLQVTNLRDFMKEQNTLSGEYLPKGVHEMLGIAETETKKMPPPIEKTVFENKVESKVETKAKSTPKPNYDPKVRPKAVANVPTDEENPISMRTTMLWVGGILAVLGIVYSLWSMMKKSPATSNPSAKVEQTPISQPTPKPVDTPKTIAPIAPAAVGSPRGSLEEKMTNYINNQADSTLKSKWLDFDKVSFEGETATLKPESMTQIQNIITILKENPRVTVKIGGFVDNATALANPKLSSQRAISVFRELTKAGIVRTRLRADGYGATVPIASNDTEEGKAKNRRVALVFITK